MIAHNSVQICQTAFCQTDLATGNFGNPWSYQFFAAYDMSMQVGINVISYIYIYIYIYWKY